MIFGYIMLACVLIVIASIAIEKWRKDRWVPVKCTWPHPEGWAVYNEWRRTFVDMGRTKSEAESLCEKYNREGVS